MRTSGYGPVEELNIIESFILFSGQINYKILVEVLNKVWINEVLLYK